MLLGRGASIDLQIGNRTAVLTWASENGQREVVEVLGRQKLGASTSLSHRDTLEGALQRVKRSSIEMARPVVARDPKHDECPARKTRIPDQGHFVEKRQRKTHHPLYFVEVHSPETGFSSLSRSLTSDNTPATSSSFICLNRIKSETPSTGFPAPSTALGHLNSEPTGLNLLQQRQGDVFSRSLASRASARDTELSRLLVQLRANDSALPELRLGSEQKRLRLVNKKKTAPGGHASRDRSPVAAASAASAVWDLPASPRTSQMLSIVRIVPRCFRGFKRRLIERLESAPLLLIIDGFLLSFLIYVYCHLFVWQPV